MIEALSFPEIFVNFLEAGIISYMVCHCMTLRGKKYMPYLLPILYCLVTTVCCLAFPNATAHGFIAWIIEIILTIALSKNTVVATFLYSNFFFFLSLLSEKLVLQLLQFLPNYSLYTALRELSYVRYFSCALYLLLFAFLAILFVQLWQRIQKKEQQPGFFLSPKLALLFLGLAFISMYLMNHYFLCLSVLQAESFGKVQSDLAILQQIGFLFLLLLVGLFCLLLGIGYVQQTNLRLVKKQKQMEIEQRQLQLLSESNTVLRTWKHDNQNFLHTLLQLLNDGKETEAKTFLSSLLENTAKATEIRYTGISAIDAVLSLKSAVIQNAGIQFQQQIYLPKTPKLSLDDVHLCALLGNILDNALEACQYVTENPYIHFTMRLVKSNLFLSVKNSCDGQYIYDRNHRLQTRKQDTGHGIGLARIEEIVAKTNGFLELKPEKETFEISILLPLEEVRYDD